MNRIYLFLITLVFTISVKGQNTARKYLSHNEENGVFSVTTNDGKYVFEFFNSEILQTSFVPNDEELITDSHAVILHPRKIKTNYRYVGNAISFGTKDISVNVSTEPFQVSYTYKGKPIISEKRGYFKSKHEPLDMVNENIVADETEKIEFSISSDEVLYGGGARALGMNRRGNRLPLYNRAHYGYENDSKLMNYTMPIVISSKKYMIHFDNAPVGYLDLDSKQNNTLTYETISGRKTYQIIVGDTWLDLVHNYTKLTGKQPMPPRWALGNFSSRFGYHSEKETKNTIQKFKDYKVPVDAVILDLYWFGKDIKGTMGNLEVYKDSFPDMKQMVSDFKKEGVKTVLITEPFVLKTSKKWDEAVQKDVLAKDTLGKPFTFDFYFGNTGLIDIYNPKGKDWFWNIYKDILNLGVKGLWGDLGEPEVHPHKLLHAKGTANEVHNIYGHDWARLIHEGYATEFPNERPFILMRAGYSGSQRFGSIPWSGDVNRSWGGLQSQPEISLQMGMQGLGYMHSDLGGFAGDNLDDELYTRWLQYGVFQPIFRPHAQEEVPSEPVFRAERVRELAKKSIELRYQLLPYNYHLAYENHTEGKPLMRPLFFEDSSTDLFENSKSYLWGNDFLITPILNSGAKEVVVHFPKSSTWFNFYTDEIVTNKTSQTEKTVENSIPTFVRAGSFIPMIDVIQNTDEYSLNNFKLHYYHHESIDKSERKLFNDDGSTNNSIEKGSYEIMEFESKVSKTKLNFTFTSKVGENYKVSSKEIEFIIHNVTNKPKKVKLQGKSIDFKWNSTSKELRIPFVWKQNKQTKLTIKL
ncbi:TIM-barrel domain-containing protein [Tenacibaculum sp. MEBiC06402]|uniref:TIM-barrel domain-containing protein n=1 Tax=unclassified Tenacibaculum TaxID=2635139 RepID=UPI003B9C8EAB